MKCFKCDVELNGEPKNLFLNKYKCLDNQYGCKRDLCIKCYNELLNIEDDAILGNGETDE